MLTLDGVPILNIIDVDTINSIIEVSNVQSEIAIVHELHIIYLFVNILISRVCIAAIDTMRYLATCFGAGFGVRPLIWLMRRSTR